MRRRIPGLGVLASVWLLGCPNPGPGTGDGGDAAQTADGSGGDASSGDASGGDASGSDSGGDGPVNPRLPLRYTPTNCAYDVRTQPGANNNTLGDTSTFGANPTPAAVHVNWAGEPSTTAAVLWNTDAETRASVVLYGTARDALTQRATGHTSSADTVTGVTLTVHEVHLCGLRPATTYYYQAGGEGHYSAVQSFTTAPDPADTTTEAVFAVTGDSRDDVNVWRNIQRGLSSRAGAQQPLFELFTGDAVLLGSQQDQWDAWFTNATDAFSRLPVVMAHGNHEGLALNYLMQFAQPQSDDVNRSELYFSFNYGPVHVIVLNDTVQGGNVMGIVGGAERDWLTADLRAVDRARTPWVVAMHHKGPFSSGSHSTDADVVLLRSLLPPVYAQGGVDLVFNGHDHDYERSVPLDGAGNRAAAGTRGTVYVVGGGAGAGLYSARTTMWTGVSASVYNFSIVRATRTALTLSAFQMDAAGNVSPLPNGDVNLTR